MLDSGRYYISLSAANYDYTHPAYTLKISNADIYKQMYTARYRHGLVAAEGYLYALGGLNSSYEIEDTTECYTPSTGMWKAQEENYNLHRQDTSAIAIDDKIYLVGGIDDYSRGAMNYYPVDDSIMVYDTLTKQWSGSDDLNLDRERVGLAEKDGNIYTVGERTYSPTTYSSLIQIYNPNTGNLSEFTSLPEGIVDPQVFFKGDIIYVVGGVNSEGYSDKVYSLENGTWTQKASAPYKSSYLRGKGYNGNFFAAAVNSSGNVDILKYDTEADEWSVLDNNFVKNRSYYGAEILNGMLYITGGYSAADDEIKNDMYMILQRILPQ